jgi:hypothetical protein
MRQDNGLSETSESTAPASSPWWERHWLAALLVLLSAVPLIWPTIPPLVDLPGHMGRYRVELDLAASPVLQHYYSFKWALIGNLGLDLLVVPLSKLVGLELAVKLIVLTIPPMTVAGFLWVAREVHGRIPPTALFAVPLAYNYPFIFGFVNFALSMAFAMLAFGLWLRLARLGHFRLRAMVFVPISLLIWLTHTFGWGTLGVMAFSAEFVRQHDRGQKLAPAALRSALHCLALAPPILLMLVWRTGHVGGGTGDWFNLRAKLAWLTMAISDRWMPVDVAALAIIVLLLIEGYRHPRLEYSRNLGASAGFLALVFLLLPRIVFGSAYADMRLAPYMIAVALIAIRFRDPADPSLSRKLALAGLAFFLVRTAATAASFWLYDRTYDRELAALDHVPKSARLVSMVGRDCSHPWTMSRLDHLPALAIVRRDAFSNDQWTMAGAQLLSVHYPAGGRFVRDPSQMVTQERCRGEMWLTIEKALQTLPRNAFDYVWLIEPPRYDPALTAGLRPVWRSGSSVLFKVER